MDTGDAIFFGVVEGLTEFLPVSSTGHLLIFQQLFGVQQSAAFNVLIQVGPIIAVCLVFWRDLLKYVTGWREPAVRDEIFKLGGCFFLTCLLCLIAKILGLELPDTMLPIALATFIGGFVILGIEWRVKGKELTDHLTWKLAGAIAAAQFLAAVFPGTSRSGAAIMAALLLGLARPAAVRFAFLVGIPTMFAAAVFEIREAVKLGQAAELTATSSLVAFAAATLTAWLAVVWLLGYVRAHTFKPFAWYRLGLGGLLLGLIVAGVIR